MRVQFVDCRYDLFDRARGRELYLEGHVPGASFLDLDEDLSDLARAPVAGRHPLPDADRFAAAASRAGIGPGVQVVAYDQGMTGGAARLWWLLRHFGHEHAAVLDGGIEAWLGPLRAEEEEIEPGAFVARPRTGDVAEAEEIRGRLGDPRLILVDARSPERFRGEVSDDPRSTLDPVPGHIPGAVNAPYAEPGLPAGLLDAEEIVVYCGSGVTACVTLLRLAQRGRPDARLYPGSWSEWSRRGLPAERS
jgi:thiosulfate/3-mercaptopyruvate sulfurtransferase